MWKKVKELFWNTPMLWATIFFSIITYDIPYYYKVIFILLGAVIDCLLKICDSLIVLATINTIVIKDKISKEISDKLLKRIETIKNEE
jgi:hypothetical protein